MGELARAADYTPARIGLGVTGVSLPTRATLEFQMDQAQARDAVYEELAMVSLLKELAALRDAHDGLLWSAREILRLRSAATGREVYLRRPDLGRRLLETEAVVSAPCDLTIVIADGLSALAVNRHAVPLLQELMKLLEQDTRRWTLGPLCIVNQGRVAIGDEIGERIGASMVLILLGERPGLSAPDSLGAYLTWRPKVGRTDAERNCVSNIRPEGLSYRVAAERIVSCLSIAMRLQLTGVDLNRQMSLETENRSA